MCQVIFHTNVLSIFILLENFEIWDTFHYFFFSRNIVYCNATQNKYFLFIHWKCIYIAISKYCHCLWIMWKKNMILWNIMSRSFFWLLIFCFLLLKWRRKEIIALLWDQIDFKGCRRWRGHFSHRDHHLLISY